jgi:tetraacyldisaccharide-1-P 4'-kinase
MGSIRRRLRSLEERSGGVLTDHEEAVKREVLRRMTDGELHRYHDVLERFETAGEVGDEDLPILSRAEELIREVRDELVG